GVPGVWEHDWGQATVLCTLVRLRSGLHLLWTDRPPGDHFAVVQEAARSGDGGVLPGRRHLRRAVSQGRCQAADGGVRVPRRAANYRWADAAGLAHRALDHEGQAQRYGAVSGWPDGGAVGSAVGAEGL